jgi:ABC-type nitrate/sulfonate/bicarbonate transport system substrate-binding protein
MTARETPAPQTQAPARPRARAHAQVQPRARVQPLTRRAWLGASAAALALAACGGRSAGPAAGRGGTPVTLMLDWYPNADHAGIYAALDRGEFARRGLDVTIQTPSDTTDQIQLVATGKADFGISYEHDLLLARAQGIPVQAVFALVQVPLNCVIALKSSGITHPAQLQGKKVGTAGTAGDQAILDAVVQADHGDPAKVQNVNVGEDLVPSLIGRKVDAIVGGYWNWEAIQIEQQGYPVNVMRLDQWGVPTFNELIVVARGGVRPELARAFDAALSAGTAYAAAHPADSLTEILKANASLSRPLVEQSLQLLQPAWKGSAPKFGYMDPQAWKVYAAWMVQEKWLPRAVDVSQAMTDAYLP